jgi:chromate transporter
MTASASPRQVTLGALTMYFLRLGTFGFGGPIALTAAMPRDLVLERRRWIAARSTREGLALAQLAPRPLGRPGVSPVSSTADSR